MKEIRDRESHFKHPPPHVTQGYIQMVCCDMQFVGHTNKQGKFLQEWLVSILVKHIQFKAKKKEKGKKDICQKKQSDILECKH